MQRSTKYALMLSVLVAAGGAVLATAGLALVAGPQPRDTPAPNAASDKLPVLGEVPAFSLTEMRGETVTRDDLRGKVWVADFMFTRCNGICPVLTRSMSAVRDAVSEKPYWDSMRLVSFSVDPTHDTPEVLRRYTKKHDATSERWLFLTADSREPIWTLSQDGFNLAVEENPENSVMPITHSGQLILVDENGRIRGYYSGLRSEGREALLRDLDKLMSTPQ